MYSGHRRNMTRADQAPDEVVSPSTRGHAILKTIVI